MNPRLSKAAKVFTLRFILILTALELAWVGVSGIYGTFFCLLGGAVFSSSSGNREVEFSREESQRAQTLTRISIVNRDLMNADGSGPVRNLDINMNGFWNVIALMVALILATPLSWRRRIRAMLWALCGFHVFILLVVSYLIWMESRFVSLVFLPPFWTRIAEKFQEALISQLGLAIPVIFWIVVTFRKEDATSLISNTPEP